MSENNNLVLPSEFGLLTKQAIYLNRYVSTLTALRDAALRSVDRWVAEVSIEPLLPFVDDPDFKCSRPLTPFVPASAVMRLNAPLLVALPDPEATFTDPPVTVVLSPARSTSWPPDALTPAPTTILTLPPVPLSADPDRTTTEPLLPTLPVPVFRWRPPLTPAVPAATVAKLNAPLLVALPKPGGGEVHIICDTCYARDKQARQREGRERNQCREQITGRPTALETFLGLS